MKVSPIAGFTPAIPSRVVTAFDINSACVKQPFMWRSCEHKSAVLDGTSTKRQMCDVLSRSMPLRRRLYNTRSTSCPGQRIKVGEVILICLPRALDLWRLVTKFVVPDFLGSLCCIREVCRLTLGGLFVSSDGPSAV